ncbi:hypothetical protein EIN_080660 [Entamoeba invadens IP1]|uniref:hypothetical protein n=1 Tax=Entamoeba invadens IP1 TaxID=370355 RepID=UPI0002C3F2E4|nr:hypothetical protein EIN_080660 [Entamoeba invadens IP1]ELP85094.1 hypothetical protein EIN_080660 [Entamoeba invadens IP1]|eukprot:XP_004184440.1 hypothetical protein EIN_080660 [Entamoeba invadens IP1]
MSIQGGLFGNNMALQTNAALGVSSTNLAGTGMSSTNLLGAGMSSTGLGGAGMSNTGLAGTGMSNSGLAGTGMSSLFGGGSILGNDLLAGTQTNGVTSSGTAQVVNGTLITGKVVDISKTKVIHRFSFTNDEENRTPEKYKTIFESPLSEIDGCLLYDIKIVSPIFSSIQCEVQVENQKETISCPRKVIDDFCKANKVSDTEAIALCYLLKKKKLRFSISNLQNQYYASIVSTLVLLDKAYVAPSESMTKCAFSLVDDIVDALATRHVKKESEIVINAAFLLLRELSAHVSFDQHQMDLIKIIQKQAGDKEDIKMKCFLVVVGTFIKFTKHPLGAVCPKPNIALLEDIKDDAKYALLYIIVMRLQRKTNVLVLSFLEKIINNPQILTKMATSSVFSEDGGKEWINVFSQLILSFVMTCNEENIEEIFSCAKEFGTRLLDCLVVAVKNFKNDVSLWDGPLEYFVPTLSRCTLDGNSVSTILAFFVSVCDNTENAENMYELFVEGKSGVMGWEMIKPSFTALVLGKRSKSGNQELVYMHLYIRLMRKIFKHSPKSGEKFLAENESFVSMLVEALTGSVSVNLKAACLDLIDELVVLEDDMEDLWNVHIQRLQLFQKNTLWDIVKECDKPNGLMLLSSFVKFFIKLLQHLPKSIAKEMIQLSSMTQFFISSFSKLPNTLKYVLDDNRPFEGKENKFCFSLSRRFIMLFTELSKLTGVTDPKKVVSNLKDVENLPTEIFMRHIYDNMYKYSSNVIYNVMFVFLKAAKMIERELSISPYIKRTTERILDFIDTFMNIPDSLFLAKEMMTSTKIIVRQFEQRPRLISFVLSAGINFEMGDKWFELFEVLLKDVSMMKMNEVFRDEEMYGVLHTYFMQQLKEGGVMVRIVSVSMKRTGGYSFGMRIMGIRGGENIIDPTVFADLVQLIRSGEIEMKICAASIISGLLHTRVSKNILWHVENELIPTILSLVVRPTAETVNLNQLNLELLTIYNFYVRDTRQPTSVDLLMQIFNFYAVLCRPFNDENEAVQCLRVVCANVSVVAPMVEPKVLLNIVKDIIGLIQKTTPAVLFPLSLTLMTVCTSVVDNSIATRDKSGLELLSKMLLSIFAIMQSHPMSLGTFMLIYSLMLQQEGFELPQELMKVMPMIPFNPAHISLLTSYVQHHEIPKYVIDVLPTLFENPNTFPLLLAISTTRNGCLVLLRQGIFSIFQTTVVLTPNQYIWRVLRNVSENCTEDDLQQVKILIANKPTVISMLKFPDHFIRSETSGVIKVDFTLSRLETHADIVNFIINVWNGNGDHPIIGDLLTWIVEMRNFSVNSLDHSSQKYANIGKKTTKEDCALIDIMSGAFDYIAKVLIRNLNESIFSQKYNEAILVNFMKQLYSTTISKLENVQDELKEMSKMKEETINIKHLLELSGENNENVSQTRLKTKYSTAFEEKVDILNKAATRLNRVISIFQEYFPNLI